MKNKRSPKQLEEDIANVLARMGELMNKFSFPYVAKVNHSRDQDTIYGAETEFLRKWTDPRAENTYNNYVKILTRLNEEKLQNGKQTVSQRN